MSGVIGVVRRAPSLGRVALACVACALAASGDAWAQRLSEGRALVVSRFEVAGNTVLSDDAVEAVLAPWRDRALGPAELLSLREALTRLYVENGYITSGATIPDQRVDGGVLRIEMIEGRLAEVRVSGLVRLRRSYVRDRVAGASGEVLNVRRLEQRLQVLQLDPMVARVRAHLEPTSDAGESRLLLDVEESRRSTLGVEMANEISPNLGGLLARVDGAHLDAFGRGDVGVAELHVGPGLVGYDVGYSIPVTRFDTRLAVDYRHDWSRLVTDPFDRLVITGRQWTVGVTLTQPLHRGRHAAWLLGFTTDVRRSGVEVEGEPFSFYASQVEDDGESRVTALRVFQDWSWRTRTQVFATRVAGSFGIDAFDATTSSAPDVPGGEFITGLAQLRYAQLFASPIGELQLIARADGQIASTVLLPMERFTVGGARSVRGYLENERIGDHGASGSLELRIPLLRDAFGDERAALAVFSDVGRAWVERDVGQEDLLASVGLGLLYAFTNGPRVQLYWGHRLTGVARRDVKGAQAHGFYLGIRHEVF